METGFKETLPAMDILVTFSDEPDWGMDQNLFPIEEYGYGLPPFGARTGKSSQAPFHMAFFHENLLIRCLLPRLDVSCLPGRLKLFRDLAGLAFRTGADYWGWRFAAWSTHYLQDLTQPYHATPFPPMPFKLLVRFLRNPHPVAFTRENKNYLVNRHVLFEAAVHFILNDAVKSRAGHPCLSALTGNDDAFGGTLDDAFRRFSKKAAQVAHKLDRTTVELFQHRTLDDPEYSLSDDPGYLLQEHLPAARQARPGAYNQFVELVSDCLFQAGTATRYMAAHQLRPGR